MKNNATKPSTIVAQRAWHVLYTRPKFERKIVRELGEYEIQNFSPTRTVLRIWSDRRKFIDEPLFPCYVFVYTSVGESYQSLQPNGVISMVSFGGKPAVIPESQIDSIRLVIEKGKMPEPCEYLNIGDHVEVIAGPLEGLRGILAEHRGQKRLLLNIDTIQKSLAVEIESGYLRQLNC